MTLSDYRTLLPGDTAGTLVFHRPVSVYQDKTRASLLGCGPLPVVFSPCILKMLSVFRSNDEELDKEGGLSPCHLDKGWEEGRHGTHFH